MMPLIVKDFSWRQTQDTLYVSVPIAGIAGARTSFITAPNYIRLHCHPHYFEAFLWGAVDDCRGKCTLEETQGLAVFELPKATVGDWPSLQVDVTSLSRPEKHAIRTRAVELSQKRVADEIAAGLERREANRQMTIREQLRLDQETRERIASLRTFQRTSVMNEFAIEHQGKSNKDDADGPGEAIAGEVLASPGNAFQSPSLSSAKALQNECIPAKDLNGISTCWSDGRNSSRGSKQKGASPAGKPAGEPAGEDAGEAIWSSREIKGSAGDALPPIRQEATIKIAFTPRVFPTPSRESTAVEEEEWLKKQAEVRKTCGFNDDDLRPEERDPQWLHDKGESLMRAGSYVGAVSAFSTGIKMAPKMGQLYAGRARAHMALQNVRKAVEDATEGLEHLMPRVAQNAQDRLQCYRVRAEAFRSLKLNRDALSDLQQALRLDPENADLQSLVKEVTRAADEDYFRDSSDEEAQGN